MKKVKSGKTSTVLKKTVDTQHIQHINNIKSNHECISKLQCDLRNVIKDIENMESLLRTASDKEKEEIVDKLIQAKDKRIDIEHRITKMKNDNNELLYLENNATILYSYYDIVENGNVNTSAEGVAGDILSYFTCPNNKTSEDKSSAVLTGGNNAPGNNIDSRGNLLEKYMAQTDSNFIKTIKNSPLEEVKCEFCESMDITIMLNDGYQFCNNCNTIEYVITDHDKPSYRDPPKEISYFAYKRINHYTEWLNQIQGKETTDIPEELYDKILLEIKKQRITNMTDLTQAKIKEILKKLGQNKYYEHSPHIMNKLNGQPMPYLSPELEEKLKQLFKQIQTPFIKHSPRRKNFLSYSFVIHKFLQLLGNDELLHHFNLLKSREKLAAQDSIWRKICEELDWEFIPSL